MSDFKWSKGQARGAKSFTNLAKAISDDHNVQKEFFEFIQSVAMKTDVKHINLYESSGSMGTSLQHAAMNTAGDEMTWIDPASGGNLSCSTMAINVAALADGGTINMATSGWAAVYDADSWVTVGTGITAPTDGVYIIKSSSECDISGDYSPPGDVSPNTIAYNALKLHHYDSADALIKTRNFYSFVVSAFTLFWGIVGYNSETEQPVFGHVGCPLSTGAYGSCHIDAVIEMDANDYIAIDFIQENGDFSNTADVDIELSMTRIKDLT